MGKQHQSDHIRHVKRFAAVINNVKQRNLLFASTTKLNKANTVNKQRQKTCEVYNNFFKPLLVFFCY